MAARAASESAGMRDPSAAAAVRLPHSPRRGISAPGHRRAGASPGRSLAAPAPQRGGWGSSETLRRFPSGSLNQATFAPEGEVHIPS